MRDMSAKDTRTLYERLLEAKKIEDQIREELKEHPEELEKAKAALEKIDKAIVTANDKLTKLKEDRKKSADIVSIMTGGRPSTRAPSGRGKSKIAFEFLATQGVGAMITVKQIAEASGMIGGASGAWAKRAVDAGFLEQEAPRMPYKIVKVPA